MITSNKKLTGFCIALLLSTWSTASVGDNTAPMCFYDLLTSAYDYLAACGVNVSAERYEMYERLHNALKDFINSNTPLTGHVSTWPLKKISESARV